MTTSQEKTMNRAAIMDRIGDDHDSAKDFLAEQKKGAEFYQNNQAENLAKKTSGKIRKVLDFFNPIKNFKEIKQILKNGIKKMLIIL